jgi:hypothetical protein
MARKEMSPMRTDSQSTSSVSNPTPPNAFTPEYLEEVRGRNETLTAAEAELAGPWKVEPVPGRPGVVAVLRVWENLEAGDVPFALFLHEEQARRCAAVLPAVGREPLVWLGDEPEADGYPLVHVYGEQGAVTCGWLVQAHPGVAAALHLTEALARRPVDLAAVVDSAGGIAIDQVGSALARTPG